MIKIISNDKSWNIEIEGIEYHFYYSNIEAIEGLNLDGFDRYERDNGFKIADKLITATKEWNKYKKDFEYTLQIETIKNKEELEEVKKDNFKYEIPLEELEMETWTEWEMEQLEKHDGEVFVDVEMAPIPYHSNNSRRYNIYNQNSCNNEKFEEVDLMIDCEIIEDGEGFKIVEL